MHRLLKETLRLCDFVAKIKASLLNLNSNKKLILKIKKQKILCRFVEINSIVMKAITSQNKAVENKIEEAPKSKNGFVDKDGVYHLSDYQLERLAKSRKQFEDGDFFTQEEVDLVVEKWLKEE